MSRAASVQRERAKRGEAVPLPVLLPATFEVDPRDIGKLTGQKLYVSSKTSCSSTRMSVGLYERFILAHGASRSFDPGDADIILLDSCAATDINERLSIKQLVESRQAAKAGSKVIVSGCLAAVNPDVLRSVPGTEIFSPNKTGDLARILGLDEAAATAALGGVGVNGHFMGYEYYRPTFADQTLFRFATALHKINNRVLIDWLPIVNQALSSSQSVNPQCYGLTISQGCMGNCTFCVTQLVKGKTRSVPMGVIVDEIRARSEEGVRHFYLSSEDTGSYGVDIGTSIVDLLDRILTIRREFGIYITFFDPRWIKVLGDRLLPLLRDGRIKHFMIPMQSGSNTVLQRMRRGYRVEQVVPFFERMHQIAPKVSLASGVIAGFPGETDEEFEQTRALLRKVPFDRLDVHPYCDRPGAEAETMGAHLPQDVIEHRVKVLRSDWHYGVMRGLLTGRRQGWWRVNGAPPLGHGGGEPSDGARSERPHRSTLGDLADGRAGNVGKANAPADPARQLPVVQP